MEEPKQNQEPATDQPEPDTSADTKPEPISRDTAVDTSAAELAAGDTESADAVAEVAETPEPSPGGEAKTVAPPEGQPATVAPPEDKVEPATAPGVPETAPPAATAHYAPPPSPPSSSSDESEGGEFARLLATDAARQKAPPKRGEEVTGTLVQIGEVDSFVDCGGRNELPIATAELRQEDGSLKYQVGDTIKARVQKSGDDFRLTIGLKLRGQDFAVLQRAHADHAPVEGTVRRTNKGGFTVDLAGFRAFCPYSQIDLHRVDDPDSFVGRKFTFRIIELAESGRNIVISRRVLLQEERETLAVQTRQNLTLGDVLEGTVTRLAPFGAFVDIGGLEGLVHISQISHERVQDTASVLQVGQRVKVKVLEIQNLGEGRRERISLSMKALTTDPWPETAKNLQVGGEVTGHVTRLTDFGAFVELQPGVEGLIHISELARRRILHPREVVAEGEEVPVRILDVDLDRRRISLSLKQSQNWEGD